MARGPARHPVIRRRSVLLGGLALAGTGSSLLGARAAAVLLTYRRRNKYWTQRAAIPGELRYVELAGAGDRRLPIGARLRRTPRRRGGATQRTGPGDCADASFHPGDSDYAEYPPAFSTALDRRLPALRR